MSTRRPSSPKTRIEFQPLFGQSALPPPRARQGQRYGVTEIEPAEAGIGLHRLGIVRSCLVVARLLEGHMSERHMGHKSHGIEWAQPQRAIGVGGRGGGVAARSVDIARPNRAPLRTRD